MAPFWHLITNIKHKYLSISLEMSLKNQTFFVGDGYYQDICNLSTMYEPDYRSFVVTTMPLPRARAPPYFMWCCGMSPPPPHPPVRCVIPFLCRIWYTLSRRPGLDSAVCTDEADCGRRLSSERPSNQFSCRIDCRPPRFIQYHNPFPRLGVNGSCHTLVSFSSIAPFRSN